MLKILEVLAVTILFTTLLAIITTYLGIHVYIYYTLCAIGGFFIGPKIFFR